MSALLSALFIVCIVRLWLFPITSSLWVDEIVTTFVVRHPGDPSFAIAPQVPASLYYWLPRFSWDLFGTSELALRLPSLLAMGAALFLIARIAARLIHPRAGWLAVFLCLSLRYVNYYAVDARPYGLGIAVAAASILFLIRWFDEGKWPDAAAFAICAAVLWRIHLLYWPFYLIYPIYGAVRLRAAAGRQTEAVKISRAQVAVVLLCLLASLSPVLISAARLSREAREHTFNPRPTVLAFINLVHVNVVLICAGLAVLAWILARWQLSSGITRASWILLISWWFVCPVCLFAYSALSGNGLLISRYVSLMYPAIALVSAALLVQFLPDSWIRPAAAIAGMVALVLMGQWNQSAPSHDISDWRDAAAAERMVADGYTTVLCASPFIEARTPAWRPDYPRPSFLYSHLTYYPIRGDIKVFPFARSPQSDRYADQLLRNRLIPSGRFLVYGARGGSKALMDYLVSRPELSGWHASVREFGDVLFAQFEAGGSGLGAQAMLRK